MPIDLENIKTIADKISASYDNPQNVIEEISKFSSDSISNDQLLDYCAAFGVLKDSYGPNSEVAKKLMECYISKKLYKISRRCYRERYD